MSTLGIDVGSTAVKAVAYDDRGAPLGSARAELHQSHPRPGCLEIEPEPVVDAALGVLARLAGAPALDRDPPVALAIAACGREAFPVDADGRALGPCMRSADQRGGDLAAEVAALREPEQWIALCGHRPERMDPALRLLWWREHEPATLARAHGFWGWHELLTHRLCGRAVTDPSLASHWLPWDLHGGGWSSSIADELGIDLDLLPMVEPWGRGIGCVRPGVAASLRLSPDVLVGVGGFDTTCAALGCGAAAAGVVGLSIGSYEAGVAPVAAPPSAAVMRSAALALGPHPGAAGFGVFLLSPNGTMALDRVRGWVGESLERLEGTLAASGSGPSPVLAVPHLAGAGPPWPDGGCRRGALHGLTLTTTPADIVQAMMEGIGCDLALTLDVLRDAGVEIAVARVGGGGSRSDWWMQLKADLCRVSIEVVAHEEPGTLGAALLARLAAGDGASLEDIGWSDVPAAKRFKPDSDRGERYAEKLAAHARAASPA